MSFGLLINDETGARALSTDDFTYNVIYSEVITLSAGVTEQTVTVPGFSSSNCVFVVYHHRPDQVPGDTGAWAHHMLPAVIFTAPGTFRLRGAFPGYHHTAFGQFQLMAMRVS